MSRAAAPARSVAPAVPLALALPCVDCGLCCSDRRGVLHGFLGGCDGLIEGGRELGGAALVHGHHFRVLLARLLGHEFDQVGVLASNEEEADAVARAKDGVAASSYIRFLGVFRSRVLSHDLVS